MLRGSALHVHVHGDGHLPVHTEEAPVKRSASKFPVIHLITGFMPPLFQYPTSIIFCVHPPRITLIFEVHSRYYISEHVISLQIITTWLKALRTGKLLSLEQHGWKKPTNIGVLFSATHSPHLAPPHPSDGCFQSSSGETVTSLVSMSPALPKKERRYRKKRSKDYQVEIPPEIPAKGKQVPQLGVVTAFFLRVNR